MPFNQEKSNSPVAIIVGVAGNNAVLNVGHGKGVHKVSLTLVLLVAVSSRATVKKSRET